MNFSDVTGDTDVTSLITTGFVTGISFSLMLHYLNVISVTYVTKNNAKTSLISTPNPIVTSVTRVTREKR